MVRRCPGNNRVCRGTARLSTRRNCEGHDGPRRKATGTSREAPSCSFSVAHRGPRTSSVLKAFSGSRSNAITLALARLERDAAQLVIDVATEWSLPTSALTLHQHAIDATRKPLWARMLSATMKVPHMTSLRSPDFQQFLTSAEA